MIAKKKPKKIKIVIEGPANIIIPTIERLSKKKGVKTKTYDGVRGCPNSAARNPS